MKSVTSVLGAIALIILSAVVSPLVVEKYQQSRSADSRVISVREGGRPVVLSPKIRAAAVPTADGEIKLVHSLTISNIGNADIFDFSIELVGENGESITDVGDFVALGAAKSPKGVLKDGRLLLNFELLKKKEVVAFWIATPVAGDIEVRSKVKDLTIKKSDEISNKADFWLFFLGALLFLFGGFILGAFANNEAQKAALRAIGFNPKEVQKLYLDSIKKT